MRLQMFFSVNLPQKAKNCLVEMQRMGVKITISVINATISGLDDLYLSNETASIYQWASKLGLEPDLITYNLLLRSFMRRGKVVNAKATLETMLRAGIRPDIVTYSEFVSGMYAQGRQPLPLSTLQSVLQEMSKLNISPNLHFFNSVINIILRNFADVRAAYEVLDLIQDPKLRYSAITCSLFIKHHLQNKEFDYVDALFAAMRKNKVSSDSALFNVTITGYAKAGKVERMLLRLGQMNDRSKTPSVSTYIAVLECLHDADQIQTAASVARDMFKHYNPENKPRLEEVLQALIRKGMGPVERDKTLAEKAYTRYCLRTSHRMRSLAQPDKSFNPHTSKRTR